MKQIQSLVVAISGTNMANPTKEQRMVVLTTVRKSLAPYLPPPVLKGLYNTDVYFHLNNKKIISHDQFEDEPSMAILSALFMAYIVLRSIQGLWLTTTKRSTVHLSGEEDTVLAGLSVSKGSSTKKQIDGTEDETPTFKETVVICGASNSGKTALLHSLCDNTDNAIMNPPMTVASLSANVGYVICPWEDANDKTNSGNMAIRVIDYPGHPSLLSQLTTLLLASATSRLVFTIDTTQPVTEGASLMYQYILTHSQVRQSWAKVSKTLEVLVVCTKTDAKGAKNYKRMKIQLRNELDKLRKVDMAIKESSTIDDDDNDNTKTMLQVKGKSIDLDNLGLDVPVSLHFVESGFDEKANILLRDFLFNGRGK